MRRAREDSDSLLVTPTIGGPLFADEPAGGPFDRSIEKPTPEEILIGEMIWRHQGRANAVSLGEISQVTHIDSRAIKTTVQTLRNKHLCQIGSKHYDPPGYYWIVDDEDRRLAAAPLRSQMLAMFDTLQVIDTRKRNSELLEQMGSKL